MDLSEATQYFHLSDTLQQEFEPDWDHAQAEIPEDIPELEDDSINRNADYAKLDAALKPRLLETARTIRKNPALKALFRYCYFRLYRCEEVRDFRQWPQLDDILGDNFGLFYLLISLGLVPITEKKHQELGVPEEITRQTVLQISCYNLNHMTAFDGAPGILRNQLYWLHWYTSGVIFRIGRFEYRLKPVGDIGKVYRNRQSGAKLLFARDGERFDREGYVDGIDDKYDDAGWTVTFAESDDHVSGNPVSPFGHAENRRVTLSLAEWELYLDADSQVLDLHIPAGGGMDIEACRDSFEKAFAFFSDHFTDFSARAFYCNSWIFNPLFSEELPESNLAGFMNQQYLFPVKCPGNSGFFFVFCRDYDDLSQAPRKTSLQRAMLETLEAGKPLRSGGMLFFTEDLHHFGDRYYQNLWQTADFQRFL